MARASRMLALVCGFLAAPWLIRAAPPTTRTSDPPAARINHGRLYEGAFLAGQTGRLVTLEGGATAFIFEPGPNGRAVPPMALLPCTTLERMEQVRRARETEPRFRVSGQVFLYEGRNYLLPTSYQTLGAAADTVPAQADAAPGAEPDPADVTNPSVEDLIGAVERLSPADRPEVAPAALPANRGDLWPDGTYLRPRTGHVSRLHTEAPVFTIDNDADSPTNGPTTLFLLPSRALDLIEQLTEEQNGGPSRFQLSGRVFQYQGRNYLLPSLVRVEHDHATGLTSAQ